jgi:hypothetical protein
MSPPSQPAVPGTSRDKLARASGTAQRASGQRTSDRHELKPGGRLELVVFDELRSRQLAFKTKG